MVAPLPLTPYGWFLQRIYHIPCISFYNYFVKSLSCCSTNSTPSCLSFTSNRTSWTNFLRPRLYKIPIIVPSYHNHTAISFSYSYIKVQFNPICSWRIPFGSLDDFLISSLPACLCYSKALNICLAISIGLLLTPSTLTLFLIIHRWSHTIATKSWKFMDFSLFSPASLQGTKSFSPNLKLRGYLIYPN